MPGHDWLGGLRPDEARRLYEAVHTDPRDARIAELESQLAAAERRAEEAEAQIVQITEEAQSRKKATSDIFRSMSVALSDEQLAALDMRALLDRMEKSYCGADPDSFLDALEEWRALRAKIDDKARAEREEGKNE